MSAAGGSDGRESVLGRSLAGAANLISANAFSRILTFALNQVLLMYFTTPAVLGVVHVQLELLLSTILFLGREPARMTVLRQPAGPEGAGKSGRTRAEAAKVTLRSIVDLSYISIGIGACLTFLVTGLFAFRSGGRVGLKTEHVLYAGASLLELLAEPMYLVGQHRMMLSQRAQVEALAATGKTAAIVAAMAYFYASGSASAQRTGPVTEQEAIVAFAVGQLAYGLATLLAWVVQWRKEFGRIHKAVGTGKKGDSSSNGPQENGAEESSLAAAGFAGFFPGGFGTRGESRSSVGPFFFSYCIQTVLKFLLNEGDRLLLNWFASLEQQGVWAFVFNYGSLVVRILFLPVEDSLRAFMSKSDTGTPAGRKALAGVLSTILHIYLTYLALPMWFLAPAFAEPLVALVGGAGWLKTGTAGALAVYCCFLPVLASNGVTEAFVQTLADSATMSRYSSRLVLFWIAFAGSAWALMVGFVHWGAAGMICAAALNAALRLEWGLRYAASQLNAGEREPQFSLGSRLRWPRAR
ncbi:Rft protein-domain-containing protein [Hyaloraphidium curvatum]|nr:Rft protein-domain-containing protein [Hyaloraphidium curvatum]